MRAQLVDQQPATVMHRTQANKFRGNVQPNGWPLHRKTLARLVMVKFKVVLYARSRRLGEAKRSWGHVAAHDLSDLQSQVQAARGERYENQQVVVNANVPLTRRC